MSILSRELDFINVMTYDFHGKWEKKTGHNCPLYPHRNDRKGQRYLNMAFAARYWLKLGAKPEKLIIGVPVYGRTFTLSDRNKIDVGSPAPEGGQPGKYTRESGYMAYYEVSQ